MVMAAGRKKVEAKNIYLLFAYFALFCGYKHEADPLHYFT